MCTKIAVKSKVFSSFLILTYRNGKKVILFLGKIFRKWETFGKGLEDN